MAERNAAMPLKHHNKENNCETNLYKDLKKVLQLLNIPGRSYLTTKTDMCNSIKNYIS